MGRLLHLLLRAMARGLRAIAGRLTPVAAAPVAAAEPVAVDDTAGGAPGHWLEMVRRRAPGLHVSLQERGIARMARPPAAVVGPTAPSPSALEPRGRPSGTPAQPAPSIASATSVIVLPVARPARPKSTAAAAESAQRSAEAPPDLEPQTWESAAVDDDQGDWTRIPARRLVPYSSSPPASLPAVRQLSAADAAVAQNWRAPVDALPRASSRVRDVRADSVPDDVRSDTRRTPTRPELRPLPAAVPVEPARHNTATPVFAPSRDEDHALHRPVRARVHYPTPSPTPWRVEALQAAAEELAAPGFPSLPDEVSSGAPKRAPVARSSTSAPPMPSSLPLSAPLFPARRHHDSSDLVGPWPTLPAARIPALRTSSDGSLPVSPEVDRWPELLGDEIDEGNDPDLSLPSGHRERLEREQRGQSWNG